MKIGKGRIAVLIGKNGETKNLIEKTLGVRIEISSKTGECQIIPEVKSPNYNPINSLTAQKIINAINRGFNPEKALRLLEEDFEFDMFNLYNILGKSEKRIKRMKGRIIGRNGEMRKAIERFTQSYLSVYGKTVSIISNYENLTIARKAISMLLNGIPHHTVLRFLEDKYNEKKKSEFRELYKPEF
ncbi:MAG: RNA-processing protein [Promethearchaeota archaeon]|nr:MAG: RNA-processing protein [Candidatus Lokiarchaeota archaeon]